MKKPYLSRTLKCIALLIPIVFVVLFSQYYLFCFNDDTTGRIRNFYYEEDNSLDVVILGASDVYTGYAPAYAYQNYGYTSYAYTYSGNTGVLYKNQLKEILKHQAPQLLLVEVDGFVFHNEVDPEALQSQEGLIPQEEELFAEVELRYFAENTPMSLNKLDAFWKYRYDDKLSCLIPFFKYHGMWQDVDGLKENFITRAAYYDKADLLKGMFSCTARDEQAKVYDLTGVEDTMELFPVAKDSLIDFLEYCRKEKLTNVVFMRFPHKTVDQAGFDRYRCVNTIKQIIGEYGYPFVDLEQKVAEMGIVDETDYDDPEHLNIYGQRKATDYLGNLIINEFGLTPMEQSDENRAHWEECVRYFDAYFEYGEQCYEKGEVTWMYGSPWFMSVMDDMVDRAQRES